MRPQGTRPGEKSVPRWAATWRGTCPEGSILVLETIALSAPMYDVGQASELRDWNRFTVPGGPTRWVLPDLSWLDGLGHLSVSRDPLGQLRVHAEANLTSVLHGADRKYASLHPSEVSTAASKLVRLVHGPVPTAPDGHEHWSVKRLDPSRTYLAGDRLGDVLNSASESWMRRKNGRQVVTDITSSGRTVTFKHSKALSWSVYDKSAEHDDAPPGLLRLECRVRPGRPLSLIELENAMDEHDENEAALESLTAIAGEAGLQLTKHLIAGGAEPAEALRLGMPALLLAQFGDHGLVNAGIPERSARRIRLRVRELLDAAGDLPVPESGAAILQSSPQVYARDEAS